MKWVKYTIVETNEVKQLLKYNDIYVEKFYQNGTPKKYYDKDEIIIPIGWFRSLLNKLKQ